MKLTMVKKIFADGSSCDKCEQAEARIKGLGLWALLDDVVYAHEADSDSPGMRLAAELGVERAPFFVVEENGERTAHLSVIKFIKEYLEPRRPEIDTAPEVDVDAAATQLEGQAPIDIVRWALERFGRDCAIAFSGAEDVALIDLAKQTGLPFSVFCLDTGRLHAETYRYLDDVRRHYALDLEFFTPQADALQAFVREKGLYSFFQDGHQECCGVRKIEPLRRALSTRKAWMTGVRHDQSPATREAIPVVQADGAFKGAGDVLVKVNPVANWSAAEVWSWIREHEVPFNPLHERGFRSIGCEPCTRPTHPGQHEREGRWWWEEATKRECGLHVEK